jgi:RNA polymerase sigma-70 factor (sigma-E family)
VDFEQYAREQTPRLLRFAAVLTNDNGTAEDAVQNVLMKAHAQWLRVSAVEHPQAYLQRMLVNEITSWRRKWSRFVPQPDSTLDGRVDDGTAQVDDHLHLLAELSKLPGRQRAAVTLRYLEDLSDADIALILECRETTVRGYIHRALRSLRIEMSATAVLSPSCPAAIKGKEA